MSAGWQQHTAAGWKWIRWFGSTAYEAIPAHGVCLVQGWYQIYMPVPAFIGSTAISQSWPCTPFPGPPCTADAISPALLVRASMPIPLVFQPFHVSSIPKNPINQKSWADVKYDALSGGCPTEVCGTGPTVCVMHSACTCDCDRRAMTALLPPPRLCRHTSWTQVCCPTSRLICFTWTQGSTFVAQRLVWYSAPPKPSWKDIHCSM